MSDKIKLLERGLPVDDILWNLRANEQLWNQNRARTQDPTSPHHALDDIWARYADPATMREDGSHDSVWYPGADALDIKRTVMAVMASVQGTRLGGVLITRIPPGAKCLPHTDPGWHARYYEKYALQITSAPGQAFCFEDARLESKPGDLYWFDNSHVHWVENPTAHERVTMIMCIKKES